jgi:hypothetical protein
MITVAAMVDNCKKNKPNTLGEFSFEPDLNATIPTIENEIDITIATTVDANTTSTDISIGNGIRFPPVLRERNMLASRFKIGDNARRRQALAWRLARLHPANGTISAFPV